MDNSTISSLIKIGLKHSIAQAFLIFSGSLVIISILWSKEYVNLAFFTLFYALIAHYLTALRKHESLGRYAVGNNKDQVVLFTIIYISLFTWWSTGAWSILLKLGQIKWCPLFPECLPILSSYALIISLILITIWILQFFCNMLDAWQQPDRQQQEAENNFYKTECSCRNCDNVVKVSIPKGVKINDYPCPNCGVITLKK